MYASQEARDGDIEELAAAGTRPSSATGSSARRTDLADAIDARAGRTSGTPRIERVPGGRTFPAGGVPGMRLREVEIHHADLGAGYARGDWPPAFAVLLLDAMSQTRRLGDRRSSAHATTSTVPGLRRGRADRHRHRAPTWPGG